MREVCFLLAGERVLGVYAGSQAAIPDSRSRWNDIWRHRRRITEIVHTHPGNMLAFSGEDLATMDAVEAGTGRIYTWSIVTHDGYLSRVGARGRTDRKRDDHPMWLGLLRAMSFGGTSTRAVFIPAERAGKTRRRGVRARRKRARKLERARSWSAKRQLLKRRGR